MTLNLTPGLHNSILLNTIKTQKDARNNPDAEVVLTFALVCGKNTIISNSFNFLKTKLHINSVPEFLFIKKFLTKTADNKIVSLYSIEEPQSYMRNASWLHLNVSSSIKSNYLKILGQRSLMNMNDFIPEHYLDSASRKNPLVQHVDRKIYFTMEKI